MAGLTTSDTNVEVDDLPAAHLEVADVDTGKLETSLTGRTYFPRIFRVHYPGPIDLSNTPCSECQIPYLYFRFREI